MSRRTANITLTILLLILIGLMVWMTLALKRLEAARSSRKPSATMEGPRAPGA